MRLLFIILCGVLIQSCASNSRYSGGGDGRSAENAIEISNKQDLIELSSSKNISDWKLHFIQTKDIVFDSADFDYFGFTPIGHEKAGAFSGSYNGNGFKIKNLFINRPNKHNVGLFGYSDSATIKNVTLENVTVAGGSQVGGLAGHFKNGQMINNKVDGAVYGNYLVGGVVGYNENTSGNGEILSPVETLKEALFLVNNSMLQCSFNGKIQGGMMVGGVAGALSEVLLFHAEVNGNIWGRELVGGLAGSITNAKVAFSNANVSLTADSEAGGLMGVSYYSSVANCYTTGFVKGRRKIGGITGVVHTERDHYDQCYADNVVEAKPRWKGPLFGWFWHPENFHNSFWNSDNWSTEENKYPEGERLNNRGLSSDELKNTASFGESWKWQKDRETGLKEQFPWKMKLDKGPVLYWQD